jgi:hypothetical protein
MIYVTIHIPQMNKVRGGKGGDQKGYLVLY